MQETKNQGELNALRNLEQAVRACGLPTMMVSGQAPLERLSKALQQVAEARSSLPRQSAD